MSLLNPQPTIGTFVLFLSDAGIAGNMRDPCDQSRLEYAVYKQKSIYMTKNNNILFI
jgi:hypothetical protein